MKGDVCERMYIRKCALGGVEINVRRKNDRVIKCK